jgi:DNA-binding response OmpR family regulator
MTLERRRQTDGSRILLVEDNDELRRLMRLALETEGYHVACVRSAEDGLRRMEVERFDLLLTDYALPGETGAWLLRTATERQLLPGGTALLVTAQPDAPEITADTEVIAKPLNLDEFLPQIRAILAQAAAPSTRPRAATPTLPQPGDTAVDDRHVRFTVRDMTADPAAAAEDRVIFTPTLVKRSPPPTVWVLGNLSRANVVTDLLMMCGIEPVGHIS